MAIDLENKQNVDPATPTFPFGDVKDNTGANDGTPYDRAFMSDYIQFFHKLFAEAGLVYNGLLESDIDGFQFFEAFIANIRATEATITQNGTVELATQGEVDTGTDATRYVTPLTLSTNLTALNWISPTFINGWVDVNMQYAKDSAGFVHFRGIADGSALVNVIAFNLPVGVRPMVDNNNVAIIARDAGSLSPNYSLSVASDGNVRVNSLQGSDTTPSDVSFNNINFHTL